MQPHPNLKRPAALTDREVREIGHYKRIQKEVHRGPLYTQPTKRDASAPAKTFGEDQFNRQYSTNPKADFDPFTGVETYSQAFQPKANELPKFAGRPFSKPPCHSVPPKLIPADKSLFPKELWPALEGKAGAEVRKTLCQAQAKKTGLINSLSINATAKQGDRTKIVLEKMDSVIPDQEEEEDEDQEQAEEENDDAFDDESMGGDYDAEQYFDNGEDGSEGDGGGRGGDDDY